MTKIERALHYLALIGLGAFLFGLAEYFYPTQSVSYELGYAASSLHHLTSEQPANALLRLKLSLCSEALINYDK